MKKYIKSALGDLDEPITWEESNVSFLKKNKLRVVLRYEDSSHKDFYVKLGVSYFITIKKRKYVIIPECISNGKNPTIEYYFNNPFPIGFVYEISKVTPEQLWNDPDMSLVPKDIIPILTDVKVDSETLQSAFNSNWLKAMYAKPGLTTRSLLLIGGGILIVVLVVLQLTGVVDVVGWVTGAVG